MGVIMDIVGGVPLLSRVVSLVSAFAMVGANGVHVIVIWRRPYVFLRAVHKINGWVWTMTVVSLLLKHVEPWVSSRGRRPLGLGWDPREGVHKAASVQLPCLAASDR